MWINVNKFFREKKISNKGHGNILKTCENIQNAAHIIEIFYFYIKASINISLHFFG